MHKKPVLLIFAALCGVYFFSYFHRVAVPGTIFNELQTTFSLSATAVAGLAVIFLYIYGGMQFVAGMIADRFGAARPFLIGGLIMTVASLVFPLSRVPAMLFISRGFLALGCGLLYLSLVKEVDALFGAENFPFFMGILILVGNAGILCATLPFERLTAAVGWRIALFLVGVLSAVALVCATIALIANNRLQRERGNITLHGVGCMLRNIPSFPTVFCGSVNFSVGFLVQAILGKKLLQDCCGMSSATAATYTLLTSLTGAVCVFACGWIARAASTRRPIIIAATALSLTATALLTFFIASGASGGWYVIPFVLYGSAVGASPVFITSMKELNPPENAGTSVGLFNGVVYFLLAMLVNASSMVMDAFGSFAVKTAHAVIYPAVAYRTVFTGCLVLAAVSFLLSFTVRDTFAQTSALGDENQV